MTNGEEAWLKFTFDGDNGAAGSTARAFRADYDGSTTLPTTWTQFDSDKTVATAWSIRNSGDIIEIGSRAGGTELPFAGTIHRVLLRSSIDGDIIADYRADAPADRYRDSAGNVWTVVGSGSGFAFPT